jgi:hypothetical protein
MRIHILNPNHHRASHAPPGIDLIRPQLSQDHGTLTDDVHLHSMAADPDTHAEPESLT